MLTATLLMFGSVLQAAEPADPRAAAPPLTPAQAAGRRAAGAFEEVYRNWRLACDDPGFSGRRIQFDVTLDSDGRIVEGPTAVRPRSDAGWRAAAESARQALLRSEPFEVDEDFPGGAYRPTFDTSRACAVAAEPDED